MGAASHDVRIDLDDDRIFGASDEVTDDIDDQGHEGSLLIESTRGRDSARLLAPSMASTAEFPLDNQDGAYNPGTGITIGQRCQWTATDPATSLVHPLFTGILDEPEQLPQSGLQNRVRVRALGMLSTLVGKQVSTALYQDIDTGTAIERLLDAAGFPDDLRAIDVGRTVLQWWPTEPITDVKRELDRLVASEGPGAALYEDGSGNLVFKNRHAILLETRSNTSRGTFSTAFDAGEPRLSSPFTYDPGNRDRIQRCSVTVKRREAQALGEVWSLGTAVTLGANEIRSYFARAERGDPITNAQTPTTGDGDYLVTAGSLSSVTLERTSGLTVRINLRAGSDGATVTGLRLRGQRVAVVSETLIEDQLAIEGDNLPSYPLAIHPEVDPSVAQQFCDAIVGFYRHGRPRLTLTLEGLASDERLTQALAREIHDRIRVVDGNTGIDLPAYVHTVRHEVYSPVRQVTTLEVEEAVSENFGLWGEAEWSVSLWGW